MNSDPIDSLRFETAREVHGLIRQAKQAEQADPYHLRDYYGRYNVVVPSEHHGDQVDVWFHPMAGDLDDRRHYYMHYPILEDIACHRAEILFEAAKSLINTEKELALLKTLQDRFYQKLQLVADYYWATSQPRRALINEAADPSNLIEADKKEFHEKSTRIRLYLDKLHEDMALLIAGQNVTRESLKSAAKKLHQAELSSYPAIAKRDVLRVEMNTDDSSVIGNWQFFNRHYANGEYSVNSHDENPEQLAKLANFANTAYGSIQSQEGNLAIQTNITCSRYGSPTRLFEYEQDPPTSPHIIRLNAYNSIKASLIEDAALAPEATEIHHCHTHLITAGGVGSLQDHQGAMFADASVASFALRGEVFDQHGVTGTYSYCSFGVNRFRRNQNSMVEFNNHVALLDLFFKVPGAPVERVNQQELFFYNSALQNVVHAAKTYFDAIRGQHSPILRDTEDGKKATAKHLDALYDTFVHAENALKTQSKILFDQVKTLVLEQSYLEEVHKLNRDQNYKQHYALSSLRLIYEMCDANYGQDSWANLEINGVMQALMQIACGNSGIFSSYGCKNANDRSLLISMHLYELQECMRKGEMLTLYSLQSLSRCNHQHHSQNVGLYQTIKDSGGPPKFAHSSSYETRGLKKLLKFTRLARHKAKKVLMRSIESKPARDLGHFNFGSDEHFEENNLALHVHDPTTCLNIFLHMTLTEVNFKENLQTIFSIYPDKLGYRHSRQASVGHFLTRLEQLDDIKSILQELWFHYDALQGKRGLCQKLFKTAILKLLSQFYHVNYQIDFPELLHAPKSEIETILRMEGVLDEAALNTQATIKTIMVNIDTRLTGFSYKWNPTKSEQLIEQGYQTIDEQIDNPPAMVHVR